jgi:endoglucanase
MMSSSITPTGFNFGGWISQSTLTDEHAKAFITQEDFRLVADWGFNSIRLPVDCRFLFDKDGLGKLIPTHLAFLKKVLGWSAEAGLMTILDLHETPIHSFMNTELEGLWRDDKALNLFCSQWTELTHALKNTECPLQFDILNEPTACQPADWGKAAKAIIRAVHAEHPDREVVVESTRWGSVKTLEALVQEVQAPNLIYSFHFYEPMWVTHQRAYWWKEGQPYLETVDYPGYLPNVKAHMTKELPANTRARLEFEGSIHWDKDALRNMMAPVERLVKQGIPLYCGEFGVFEQAPRSARLNWTRDVVDLLTEMNVGWSYWIYKWLDFGVWPEQPKGQTAALDEEMLSILQRGILAKSR